ncbi:MAG: hypothetical protein ABIG71_04250 [Candidatus Uhrbacteria bacterium]
MTVALAACDPRHVNDDKVGPIEPTVVSGDPFDPLAESIERLVSTARVVTKKDFPDLEHEVGIQIDAEALQRTCEQVGDLATLLDPEHVGRRAYAELRTAAVKRDPRLAPIIDTAEQVGRGAIRLWQLVQDFRGVKR